MRRPLQRALDDLRFGPSRTLNLRASLPSAAEAARRAEVWLRSKQAEGVREVLVITGRGNQSYGQVPVVREAVRRQLSLLTTRGVVADFNEHTEGSFAVRLTSLRAATSARRVRGVEQASGPVDPPTLEGLSEGTRDRLRLLARTALNALGVRDPSEAFVQDEMVRQCASLGAASIENAPLEMSADNRERLLVAAIERELDALFDDYR